jgi:hypothetical protein
MRIACALAVLTIYPVLFPVDGLPYVYFVLQGSHVVPALVALLLATSCVSTEASAGSLPESILTHRTIAAAGLVFALLLWGGTYVLFDNYPLTRDEHMVVFDMAIFRSGHLAAAVSPSWREYVHALTPAFLLPLPGNAAWVSAYMPVNAMLRTAFSTVADPALMNPLLAAAGAIALFDIAKRLFPEDRAAEAIALLLYATSAQVLVTAMTAYAMTGHLTLNLIWLALYMRGTRTSHSLAIAVGFLAIGLHQIVFHPLFAIPFIEHLRRRGEWLTAAVYVASYAAFGIFWSSYQHLVAASLGLHPSSGPDSGVAGFVHVRVIGLLLMSHSDTLSLTALNLIRFITWQNFALLPLMALGYGAVRRDESIARPLAQGVILTTAVLAFLLPYQGHGWGYRYLHGLIGNCALLGAYGWRDFSQRQEVRSFVAIGSAATLLGSLPFLVWQAHSFVRPYALVNRMIERTNADIVVVESGGSNFAVDEVRNRPDLTNRPIRLASDALNPSDIARLCSRGSIAFVDGRHMEALGVGIGQWPASANFQALRKAAQEHCH